MTIPQQLQDLLIYIRRILKQPNPQDISDATLLEYLNRFFLYDMPYQIQLFSLKTQFRFETEPNVDKYLFPINTYNQILPPAYVDGNLTLIEQSVETFNKLFPRRLFNQTNTTGDGTPGPYTFTLTTSPVIRGFTTFPTTVTTASISTSVGILDAGVYITAQDSSDPPVQLEVTDDGSGNLIGDIGVGTNTVNYLTGAIDVTFSAAVGANEDINSQSQPYQAGRPQVILFNDNIFTIRPVPDRAYLIETDAFLTPSAFLSGEVTGEIQYQWFSDYIAHGAAIKVLQDQGDADQLAFYRPIFRNYENQVLRRSSRQNNTQRTATIFVAQIGQNPYIYNSQ